MDQPLEVSTEGGTPHLLSDYNRDGDSYRSPWTNKYYPALDDGFVPTPRLRDLEVEANQTFDSYREMYYESGVSSVYLWELDEDGSDGFAGCFLVKKDVEGDKHVKKGSWNSIHVVEVGGTKGGSSVYKLTTTIMVSMTTNGKDTGDTDLSGSLTRQKTSTLKVDKFNPHLANVGRMIEDMEIEMRSNMEALYIQKTREVVSAVRSIGAGPTQGGEHTKALNDAVKSKGMGKAEE